MKFKRLLAVALACCITCTCLVIPASASSGASDDVAASVGQYYAYLDQYLKGEITYEAFQAKSRAAFQDIKSDSDRSQVQQILDGLTSSLEGISYAGANMSAVPVKMFRDAMKQLDSVFGFWDNVGGLLYDAFESIWNDYANKNNYTVTDFDMSGYGAVCVHYANGEYSDTMYCAYGIIHKQWTNQIVGYAKDDVACHRVFASGYVSDKSPSVCGYLNHDGVNTYVFYGDWRYDDGSGNESSADDLITPNGKTPKDIDDLPDDTDLSDFFKELLDKLKNLFPDLSTIDGLLNAILEKLGTLDSDNDNELLEYILVAIKELKNNGETVDNSELLKILEELKNALIIKDGDKVTTTAQLLEMLVQNQIRRSDITIDSSAYNQRYALIEAKLLGKFSFISEIKNFVQYAIDSYAKTDNSPTITIDLFNNQHTIDFSIFDGSINLVRWLVAAFVYISYAFATFRKIPGYINGGDNQ